MSAVVKTLLCCALLAASLPAALAAGEPPPLAHNPFSRPASQETNGDFDVVENKDGSGPTLALRATMVGPVTRLANVAGRVLKIGDEIDGYRLVSVHEDYAVFKKAGKLMTVYVKPQLVDDDD